jgi:L-proline amide hydrolase
VLSNVPADLKIRYKVAEQYRWELPEEVQAILNKHEEAGTTSSEEYNDTFAVFSKRHILRLETLPAELFKAAEESRKDHTVSLTMSASHMFKCTGSLRDWSMVGEARKIEVPTLLIIGEREIASDECLGPFWREIPKLKWVKFVNSAHGPWLEERERFFRVVGDFLCDD